MPSAPRKPDYAGACVTNIVPSLLGPNGTSELPSFFPDIARGARQVVLLVIDGLGWHQLRDRLSADASIAPTLGAMQGGPITTIAPTTTIGEVAAKVRWVVPIRINAEVTWLPAEFLDMGLLKEEA